jgi:hypothetical protein
METFLESRPGCCRPRPGDNRGHFCHASGGCERVSDMVDAAFCRGLALVPGSYD